MRRRGFLTTALAALGLPLGWLGHRLAGVRRQGGWVLRQDD